MQSSPTSHQILADITSTASSEFGMGVLRYFFSCRICILVRADTYQTITDILIFKLMLNGLPILNATLIS